MTLEDIAISESIAIESRKIKRKTTLADTISNLSFSLTVGTTVDLISGVKFGMELLSSRLFNITCSGITAKPYGQWRDYLYKKTKTTEHNAIYRQFGVELLAFNTFNVPTYGLMLFTSYLISKLQVDHDTLNAAWSNAYHGMLNTMYLSPLTSNAYGLYNNFIRKRLGVETPAEKAEDYIMEHPEE